VTDRRTDILYDSKWRASLLCGQKRIQTPEPSSSRNTDTYGSSLAVKSISSLKPHNKRTNFAAFHMQTDLKSDRDVLDGLQSHTYPTYLLSLPVNHNVTIQYEKSPLITQYDSLLMVQQPSVNFCVLFRALHVTKKRPIYHNKYGSFRQASSNEATTLANAVNYQL